ncbi:MAG: hypothetical protein KA764_08565 [Anaerolineales bacterium]|nr:hypothetical protein [Anaerolineales bacterium]
MTTDTRPSPRRPPQSTPIFWVVVAATLLAAGLRYLGLLSLPPQAWVDEAWFALRAREIVQTGVFPIFYKTFWGGVNPLLAWLTAGVEWLFFPRLIVASRVVSATFSLLAVPLLYAALSEFWRGWLPAPRRRWLAAVAALVLAGFFSTITLTRLGTEPGVALAAGLFCLWQQRRAARTGAWRSYALAGLAAGAAQYLSPHTRFILVVMALWGLQAVLIARPADRRRLWLGFGLLAAAALVTAAPLMAFFAREPEWFVGRARAVTVGAEARGLLPFLWDNAQKMALSFSWRGDLNGRDNLAGRPLLDPLQSVGVYLGLGLVIWRAGRAARARDLLLWLAVMLVPALITDEAPSFSRMALAAPPLAALIALGWGAVWDALRPRLGRRLALSAAAGVLAVSLTLNAVDYFVRFARQPDLKLWYTATLVDWARELITRAEAEAVFVERVPEAEDLYAFDFLLPGTPVRWLDFRQCLPLTAGRATRTTYVVWSERDAASAAELRRAFPEAAVTVIRPESEALVRELTVLEVPANRAAVTVARPAAAEFAAGLTLAGYEQTPAVVKPGESVFLTVYWTVAAPLAEDLVAFAHLGGGAPVAQHDGQPCQGFYPTSAWRPGDLVRDSFAITLPADAPAGDYPLAVGWYRYPSLERVPLIRAAQPLPDNRAVISVVTVAAP